MPAHLSRTDQGRPDGAAARPPTLETVTLSPAGRQAVRARLDAHWATLTADQVVAIARMLGPDRYDPGLRFRASVPLSPYSRRFYLSLSAGLERRNARRLEHEQQTRPARVAIVFAVAAFMFTSSAVFGAICAAYLVKSFLRLNLFPGPSPLHPLFALFSA